MTLIGKPQYWEKNLYDCPFFHYKSHMFWHGRNPVLSSESPAPQTKISPLTPNDPHRGRTAPLTSKRCILYIYSTNIDTEYFKHGIYSPFFSFQNAVCFIILTYLVSVLFTFYIQCVLKLKKNNSGAKRLTRIILKDLVSTIQWAYRFAQLHLMIQFVPHSEHTVSFMETNKWMLHSEIILCSESHTEHNCML